MSLTTEQIDDKEMYHVFVVWAEYIYESMSWRICKIERWKTARRYPKQGVFFVRAIDELDAYRHVQERVNKHD